MNKIKGFDLTDQDFDYWHVIELDEELTKTRKRKYWKCQCKCGTLRSVRQEDLTSKRSKSCGCMRKVQAHQVYNFLETIERDFEKEAQRACNNSIWKCKCLRCGNITSVSSADLKSGHTKSCGCLNRELVSERSLNDLTGKKFNKLTVIKRVDSDSFGHAKWLCQCECGNETVVLGDNLVRGHTRSCGCLSQSTSYNEERINNYLQERHYSFIPQYSFPDLKNIKPLRFDFAIFKENEIYCLIEFQGEQHYKQIPLWDKTENDFKERQKRDELKRQYCKEHNLKLYEIKYNQENQLESILADILKDYDTIGSN